MFHNEAGGLGVDWGSRLYEHVCPCILCAQVQVEERLLLVQGNFESEVSLVFTQFNVEVFHAIYSRALRHSRVPFRAFFPQLFCFASFSGQFLRETFILEC